MVTREGAPLTDQSEESDETVVSWTFDKQAVITTQGSRMWLAMARFGDEETGLARSG